MKEIKENLKLIAGGFVPIVNAALTGVGVFIAVPKIGSAIGQDWNYNTFGKNIGQGIYNQTHPNPLGQTIYTAADFPRK